MDWLIYTFRTTLIQMAETVKLDDFSNGLTIKNTGNGVVSFDGDILSPGESKSIGGNYGEILRKRLSVSFGPIANPPVGYVEVDSAVLTEKYYLPQLTLNC